jgi:hypothetical protein
MTTAARSQPSPSQLQDALAWLNAEPAKDPLRDLAPLLRNLREAADAARQPGQRLRVLELFQVRAAALTRALKPHLLDASLPLLQRLRTIAQGLIDIHGTLATLTLRVVFEPGTAGSQDFRQSLPTLCVGILKNLAEQQQAALLVAGPPPANLWANVQTVFQLLRSLPPEAVLPRANRQLKGILALTAAQPETFTARELAFLVEYLDLFSSAVEIDPSPTLPSEQWYWLEDGRDLPPVAVTRRAPPQQRTVFFFSCATLGSQAAAHAASDPASLAPSAYRPNEKFRQTLAQAAERWSVPPRRRSHRRSAHFRVEICTSLSDLWALLGGHHPGKPVAAMPAVTQWMVLNESPGGFCVMHVSGAIGRLTAGDAIGMRMPDETTWTVCLIRWARSDNPEHVEIGVEMIAPSASAISVAGGPEGAAPALLLPPLPALHRSETVLVPRGHYGIPTFTMIREADGKLQLTECRPERLAAQTASVEIIEFSRDFTAR